LDTPITIQKFTMTGGTLNGAQKLTLNDLLTFSGGTMDQAGTVNANGGATFNGTGATISTNRILSPGERRSNRSLPQQAR
jgi:hypothetical protein